MASGNFPQRQETAYVAFANVALAHATSNGWAKIVEGALRPYRVNISVADSGARVAGDALAVGLAGMMFERLIGDRSALDMNRARAVVEDTRSYALRHDLSFRLLGLAHAVQPLSLSQVAFMHVLLEGTRDLIVGVGPTGSGKTRLAIAAGLSAVASGQVKKFVATRPHIMEPGEEITASIRSETSNDFQLKPLEDELRSLLGHAEVQRRKDLEQIEILPLGHMRGRTFDDAFIVIDEAQNLTIRKMRTAVTRLGRGSRMVVVGNPQQIDLHEEEPSGLPHLLGMLSESDVAHVFEFEGAHIVRNDTVAQLEALYARTDMPRARVA